MKVVRLTVTVTGVTGVMSAMFVVRESELKVLLLEVESLG